MFRRVVILFVYSIDHGLIFLKYFTLSADCPLVSTGLCAMLSLNMTSGKLGL